MSKLYQKPRWTVCYQGEVEYQVGSLVARYGYPTVRIRHRLPYYCIATLSDPEQFWKSDVASVGVVLWRNCPWHIQHHRMFPEPEVGAMFPLNPLGRFNEAWQVEVQGDFPKLVATPFGFEMLSESDGTDPILWQGTALEMGKEEWFTQIFPKLYAPERSRIIQHLLRKDVKIPLHPTIPDTAYPYCICQGQWQVRLDRTYSAALFYNARQGWVKKEAEATVYHREDEAKQMADLKNSEQAICNERNGLTI